ncbi:MAG: FAD-dependent oxidoreductase [Burkholderiaceae bacterium]
MHIAVIGAGVVGVTTAWELTMDGHTVDVFDRRNAVASECSFANAGIIAPGYVTPWAAPGMPGKILRHLLSSHSPVRMHASLNPAVWRWAWHWLRACRRSSYEQNRSAMHHLARFSQERLTSLIDKLQLEFERNHGYLVLHRGEQEADLARPTTELLRSLGVTFKELDAVGCRVVEPGLQADQMLHGGIHLPGDEVGNCRQFTQLLRDDAEKRGAEFHLANQVLRIQPGERISLEVRQLAVNDDYAASRLAQATDFNAERAERVSQAMSLRSRAAARFGHPLSETAFDAVVVCAGVDSTRLLAPLGTHLPLLPVYGYSLTFPLRAAEHGPRSAVMDERYKVAISRLGQRLRVAGGAELGGNAEHQHQGAIGTLYKVLNDWFPGGAQLRRAQVWKGARPMLPDGPPIVGKSEVPGVWLNVGHGSSGWALSCGSARALADVIGGREAPLDMSPLALQRLGS